MKTILSDCPFCLEKMICSCCGQCVNPGCNYRHDNPKFAQMQDWYFYQRLVTTYSKAKLPIETFEEYLASRDRDRTAENKLEKENKEWEEQMLKKNPKFFS